MDERTAVLLSRIENALQRSRMLSENVDSHSDPVLSSTLDGTINKTRLSCNQSSMQLQHDVLSISTYYSMPNIGNCINKFDNEQEDKCITNSIKSKQAFFSDVPSECNSRDASISSDSVFSNISLQNLSSKAMVAAATLPSGNLDYNHLMLLLDRQRLDFCKRLKLEIAKRKAIEKLFLTKNNNDQLQLKSELYEISSNVILSNVAAGVKNERRHRPDFDKISTSTQFAAHCNNVVPSILEPQLPSVAKINDVEIQTCVFNEFGNDNNRKRKAVQTDSCLPKKWFVSLRDKRFLSMPFLIDDNKSLPITATSLISVENIDRLPALNDELKRQRPDFITNSTVRQRQIANAAKARRYFEQRIRDLIQQNVLKGDYSNLNKIPDMPFYHAFPPSEYIASAAKKYKLLPEYQQKILKERMTIERNTDRLRAKIYRQKVLNKILNKAKDR